MTDTLLQTQLSNWHPDVASRLGELISSGQAGDFAVFDFDNTCIYNDIGDVVFYYFVENMCYRFDDERFWACFDPEDRPEVLRQRVEQARGSSKDSPEFKAYMGHLGALYQAHDARHGHGHAYLWVVRLMVGMRPEDIVRWSREAYKSQLEQPLSVETIPNTWREGDAQLEMPLEIPRGVRICEDVRALMHALRSHHIDVWVVSASSKWWVEPFAEEYGIPADHVLGNRLVLDEEGRLSDEISLPKSYRAGKVELINAHISDSRPPVLSAGDAMTDFEMLQVASGLSLVIERGDVALREHAQEAGWAIQPRDALRFVSS